MSLKSAYVQRLSNDAKNVHVSHHGVRYTEPVLKVYALAAARPSAMGALDVLRGDLQNPDHFSAFVWACVDWWSDPPRRPGLARCLPGSSLAQP